ncbi:MAG: hypothetical protein E7035_05180 [Verrucomicrobiaceae bacterium]|nr:hypothetical protein [Verrucomicrobiaceae bacterium]
MKPLLLISNDDGIDSPFLPAFVKAMAKVADIEIVVPAKEQSWIGRAYSRHSKLKIEQVEFLGFKTHTVSGTPSDCVNIALSHICKKPDAVVSGLNIGQNIAFPLLWSSGTFSAAVEGASWGFPAFAFSMRLEKQFYDSCRLRHEAPKEGCSLLKNLEDASETSANYVIETLKQNMGLGEVRNVNFPIKYTSETPFKECKPARTMARPLYHENNGLYEFKYAIKTLPSDELTDFECLENGWACHSKINII